MFYCLDIEKAGADYYAYLRAFHQKADFDRFRNGASIDSFESESVGCWALTVPSKKSSFMFDTQLCSESRAVEEVRTQLRHRLSPLHDREPLDPLATEIYLTDLAMGTRHLVK